MAFVLLGVAEGLELEWLENEEELSMRDALREAMQIMFSSLRKEWTGAGRGLNACCAEWPNERFYGPLEKVGCPPSASGGGP